MKVFVKYLFFNGQLVWWWFFCCFLDGFYVVFDRVNVWVYLIDVNGNIFKIFCCSFGLIFFDKYYNIFIFNFYNCLIGVYDIKGICLIDLYLDDRLISILILYDKLFVVVE